MVETANNRLRWQSATTANNVRTGLAGSSNHPICNNIDHASSPTFGSARNPAAASVRIQVCCCRACHAPCCAQTEWPLTKPFDWIQCSWCARRECAGAPASCHAWAKRRARAKAEARLVATPSAPTVGMPPSTCRARKLVVEALSTYSTSKVPGCSLTCAARCNTHVRTLDWRLVGLAENEAKLRDASTENLTTLIQETNAHFVNNGASLLRSAWHDELPLTHVSQSMIIVMQGRTPWCWSRKPTLASTSLRSWPPRAPVCVLEAVCSTGIGGWPHTTVPPPLDAAA